MLVLVLALGSLPFAAILAADLLVESTSADELARMGVVVRH